MGKSMVLVLSVVVMIAAGAVVYAKIDAGKCQTPVSTVATANKGEKQGKESEMIVTITRDNFEQEVLKADRPVLVDFWATWCGPCRMLAPLVGEIADERTETLKVGKVNVDEAPELAAQFGITGIPALLLFKGGKVVGTSIGYVSKAELGALVDKHVGSSQ